MSRLLSLLLLLLCLPPSAHAHIAGFTDTSIQVAATGVRVLYTVPSDSLRELDRVPNSDVSPVLGAPAQYLDRVRNSWSVQAAGRRCLLTQSQSRALGTLPAYQYQFTYVCPEGMETLEIGYRMFFALAPEHENFGRVFMAGKAQHVRFTARDQKLEIPVASLLAEWQAPLVAGFFHEDPNRSLQDAQAGRESGMPAVVQAAPSLGGLDLSQIDPGFIRLGLAHIFMGLDHVLFVVGLVLTTGSWRRLLVLVTSFTAAHSATLGLSTLGLIDFDPRFTEPLIALTIVYIGLESLWTLRRRGADEAECRPGADAPASRRVLLRRTAVVFVFGLVHGVGFSYVLREMGLREDLLGSLLYFNLGVELGQLAIIAATLPVVLLWRRWPWGRGLAFGTSGAVAATGAYMLISRL
jgi:hydrogenase/urease accessory protein HupE